jgi:ACT domain-containing protein
LFKEEKFALKLYEKIDGEFILNLDDYAEDFFNVLSLINDIGMNWVAQIYIEILILSVEDLI